MNENSPNNSIHDKILSAIKSGEVKARPKWYFYAQSVLMAAGVILTGVALLFLASFIVFALRQNGGWFAPGFGFFGLHVFLTAMPWLLLVAVLGLLWLLESLLRRYQFSYQRPMLYSFVGIGLLVSVGTIVLSTARLHENLLERARHHQLMFAEPFYRQYGMPDLNNLTRGMILNKINTGYKIETASEDIFNVLISPQTRLPYGYNFIPGDVVVVIGQRDDGTIQALGVIKIQNGPGVDMRFAPQMQIMNGFRQ